MMMRHSEHVYLGAYWRQRSVTARNYIQLTHTFLRELQRLSPAFDSRCIVIGNDTTPVQLPSDYVDYEKTLLAALSDDNYLYENPDPADGTFGLESRISRGFRMTFSDSRPEASRETAVSVSVKEGSHGSKRSTPNVVLLELPPATVNVAGDRPLAKQLTNLVVDFWKPSFAAITSRELRDLLDPANQFAFTLGPLTYFADESAALSLKAPARCEPLKSGGVLLEIDEPSPWVSAVEAFRPCFQQLADAGLLNWPNS